MSEIINKLKIWLRGRDEEWLKEMESKSVEE